MDWVNHGTMGFCLGLTTQRSTEECVALAVVGILPDAVGKAEKILKRDPSAWSWYNVVHGDYAMVIITAFMLLGLFFGIEMLTLLALSIGLHLAFDPFLHKTGQRWWEWKERMWVEVVTWIGLLTYLVMHYK